MVKRPSDMAAQPSSSDTHPAAEETDIEELDSSGEDIEEPTGDIDSEGSEEGMAQATECRATSSRRDDWLHKGALSCRSAVACVHDEGAKNTEAFSTWCGLLAIFLL